MRVQNVTANNYQSQPNFGTTFSEGFSKFIEKNFEKFSKEDFAGIKSLKLDGKDYRKLDIYDDCRSLGMEYEGGELQQQFGPHEYILSLITSKNNKDYRHTIHYEYETTCPGYDHDIPFKSFINRIKEYFNVEKIDEVEIKSNEAQIYHENMEKEKALQAAQNAKKNEAEAAEKSSILKDLFA